MDQSDLILGFLTPTAVERLISGSFVLCGILIGAAITGLRERSGRKTVNTYALHREFSEHDMLKSRIKAEQLLRKNKGKRFVELYDRLPADDMAEIMVVVRFFERLHIYTANKQVNPDVVADLFGENFVYYQEQYFRAGFEGSSWKVGTQLEDLFKWFADQTDRAEFERWRAKSDQHRLDLEANAGS